MVTFSWAARCRLSHLDGGDAYQLVLFQVTLGALHIDLLLGRKLRADLIIRSGTGLEVLATPKVKSSFQIPADQAIHGYASSLGRIREWLRM
jgi:hypothetical protein